MWATPDWNVIGLWAVFSFTPAFSASNLHRFGKVWTFLFLIGLIGFIYSRSARTWRHAQSQKKYFFHKLIYIQIILRKKLQTASLEIMIPKIHVAGWTLYIYSETMNASLFYTQRIHALYGFRKASYFLLQTRLRPNLFARWFEFVDAALPPDVTEIYKIRLAMRPAFRFMNPRFDAVDRVNALTHHFTVLREKFPAPVRLTMTQERTGYRLAEVTGKSGKKYAFETRGEVTKEGGIRIVFFDAEKEDGLALLAGILATDKHGKQIFNIGMLRGPNKNNKEIIIKATKDLNGLRPKQAVLHAAAALAAWLGAEEIVAPSSEKEIAMKNLFKGHKVLANHDPFWREFAQSPAADGIYHLPLPLPRRDESEVQQKRRKDLRARYEHIDAFSKDIKNALDALSGEENGNTY